MLSKTIFQKFCSIKNLKENLKSHHHNHHQQVQQQQQQVYDGPSLERLWTYSSPLTKDRNVTCISWNSVNNVRVRKSDWGVEKTLFSFHMKFLSGFTERMFWLLVMVNSNTITRPTDLYAAGASKILNIPNATIKSMQVSRR
jgi:hypothetical protein